jgi:hypothetical protein
MEIKDYFAEQITNNKPISEAQISAMIEQREKDGYFEKEGSMSKEYFQSKIGKYLLFYMEQLNEPFELITKSVFSDEFEQHFASKKYVRTANIYPVFLACNKT